jgi:hypothetical protein
MWNNFKEFMFGMFVVAIMVFAILETVWAINSPQEQKMKDPRFPHVDAVEKMTYEEMLTMPLHSHVAFSHFTLMRVPGGWIYDGKEDLFVAELPKGAEIPKSPEK